MENRGVGGTVGRPLREAALGELVAPIRSQVGAPLAEQLSCSMLAGAAVEDAADVSISAPYTFPTLFN